MTTVAIVFMVSFVLGLGITTESGQSKCEKSLYKSSEIVDIYYAPGARNLAYHKKCKYTLTPRVCNSCMTKYILRSDYDYYKEQYEKKELMRYPFPKRFDLDRVYPAKNY